MDENEAQENLRPHGNVDRVDRGDVADFLVDDETVRVQVAEPMWGAQVGEIDLAIHAPEACEGTACPFHNPSDHHMVDWPKNVRLDSSALVERICPHGVGHPDPDSLDYFRRTRGDTAASTLGTHGCDGCCREEELMNDGVFT